MNRTFFVLSRLCCPAWLLLAGVGTGAALAQTEGPRFTVDRTWKFKPGDSLRWATADYDDQAWTLLKSGLWWGHAGYDHAGYAWYRKRVVIPANLKSEAQRLGWLRLSLGQIQDADEAYLNGVLIGKTGSADPFVGRWEEPRLYVVRPGIVNWGGENLLAVRVFCRDGNGGMHTGPYFFQAYRPGLSDRVRLAIETPTGLARGPRQLRVTLINAGPRPQRGNLHVRLDDEGGKLLRRWELPLLLKTGPQPREITLPFHLAGIGIHRIQCVFWGTDRRERLVRETRVSTLDSVALPVAARPLPIVENQVPDPFRFTEFEAVHLGGMLGARLDINRQRRLRRVDEAGLLAGYLQRPGRQNWIGEHVGKYLEAASNTWRNTHDAELKARTDRILYVLLHTQGDDGYLGTYVPERRWTSWDVWSHKYNLVGLLAYYQTTGYAPALSAARRIGDLLCRTFGNGPGQPRLVESGTHVGMASTSVLDPVVDLYRMTGDEKYLRFARYIVAAYDEPDGPGIVETLIRGRGVNEVANGKAYELLSNLVGLVKLHKLTGEERLLRAATAAWADIVRHRLYLTGAASSFEQFRGDGELPASERDNMGEGCVTTTWIQFNHQLFTLTGEPGYFDEIEKSVYNHLLGAENPRNGCVSYYTALLGVKPYSCGITCCLSSVPRGISLVPSFFYGNRRGTPTVLLYESGSVRDTVLTAGGTKQGFQLEATSLFPRTGRVAYRLNIAGAAQFTLSFRVPRWAENFTATVGSHAYRGTPGEYLDIQREWHPGDGITVTFDLPIRVVPGGKSYPDRIAFLRGPQVLAHDDTLTPFPDGPIDQRRVEAPENVRVEESPAGLPPDWVGKQVYAVPVPAAVPSTRPLLLVPFADAGQSGGRVTVWLPARK